MSFWVHLVINFNLQNVLALLVHISCSGLLPTPLGPPGAVACQACEGISEPCLTLCFILKNDSVWSQLWSGAWWFCMSHRMDGGQVCGWCRGKESTGHEPMVPGGGTGRLKQFCFSGVMMETILSLAALSTNILLMSSPLTLPCSGNVMQNSEVLAELSWLCYSDHHTNKKVLRRACPDAV